MFSKLEEFRFARWANSTNRVVQIGLSLLLVAGLNYLAAKHFLREDLTVNHRYTLGAETRSYLRQIPHLKDDPPVKIYMRLPASTADDQINGMLKELRSLLREYVYTTQKETGRDTLTVEEFNPLKNPSRTQELKNLGWTDDTVVLVTRAGHFHSLTYADLFEFRESKPTAFKGENSITSALLEMIQNKQQKVYFTVGHGELQFKDTTGPAGMSLAGVSLQQRNFVLGELDLRGSAEAPADADLLVIAGPKVPFLPYEVEKLRRYMNQGSGRGRMLVMVDPGLKDGLDTLFEEWGILADNMRVVEHNPDFLPPDGDIIISSYSKHPMTAFSGYNSVAVSFGPTRVVRPDPAAPLDDRRQAESLLLTSNISWAAPVNRPNPEKYNARTDLQGPISVAALSEQRAQQAMGLPGGRMAVFGDSAFVGNQRYNNYGNRFLFLNAVNYLLDRQNQLNILPKPPQEFRLSLTRTQLFGLAWRLTLPALALALTGVLVFLMRHRT